MSDIFLIRQPVFDRTDSAVGYELRFRDSEESGDAVARSLVSGTFDVLRDGLPAYVRTNRSQLVEGIFAPVDPRSLFLLLGPDLTPDAEVVAAVQRLSEAGVTVVLDEFVLPKQAGSPLLALLAHARAVRVDLRDQSTDALRPLVAGLKRAGKRLIADQVIDATVHKACVSLGFDAFQGPYFFRPELLPATEIPMSTATALRLMALARDSHTSERELEHVVSADPSITFQLLRIVNSAALGGRGITSIAHALRLVGRNNLVRWLALASYTARTGKSGIDDELVRQAVQRAHFSEALAGFGAGRDRGTAFLVGLFSLLDAVFRMPLAEVLERVNLADEVKSALLDHTGPYADALQVIEAYELGLWESAAEGAAALNIPPDKLPGVYAESLRIAGEHVPAKRGRTPLRGTKAVSAKAPDPAPVATRT